MQHQQLDDGCAILIVAINNEFRCVDEAAPSSTCTSRLVHQRPQGPPADVINHGYVANARRSNAQLGFSKAAIKLRLGAFAGFSLPDA